MSKNPARRIRQTVGVASDTLGLMRFSSLACVGLGLSLGMMIGCGDKGGGSDDAGEGMCGVMVCGLHEVCDEVGQEPTCVCDVGYAGVDCLECDAGYVMEGDACVPVVIDCDDNPCGLNGVCVVDDGAGDYCMCNDGYDGPTCAQCADGFQDNDANGTCAIGCDSPLAPTCDAPLVCRDDAGGAQCGCPFGTTGAECELCEDGRARRGDGECYWTCSTGEFECIEPQYCFDDGALAPATCVCPLGYQGDTCTDCAPGFVAQGSSCVATIPSGADFLALASVLGRSAVVALDSADGSTTPLVPASGIEGLVAAPTRQELFGADYVGVRPIDLAAGPLDPIASLQIGHGKPIAWNSMTSRLLTLRSSDYQLMSIDPQTSTVTEIGSTGVSWVWDATYDAASDSMVLLRSQGSTPSIHAVDPATAIATEIGPLSEVPSVNSQQLAGIAMSGGELAVLAPVLMTEEDVFLLSCRRAADRLGFDGYENAVGTSYFQATSPLTMTSQASGPEIIYYYAYSGPDTTITIDVDNPQAFLCISTYQAALNLVVSAGSTWTGGAVFNYDGSVNADVPGGFVATTPLALAGGQNANLVGAAAAVTAFRLYSSQEWYDRRMPSLSSNEPYNVQGPDYELSRYSYPGLVRQSSTPVDGRMVGGLSAR